jgi:hypothetical protein
MPLVAHGPDLAVVLRLDAYAPRAARHYVSQVDRPSPDLRDTVLLLVSDLVTAAVENSTNDTVKLRVWMPSDVVRVEVEGLPQVTERAHHHPQGCAWLLLDELADRWEVEHADGVARIWFEIDRHAKKGASEPTYRV